MTESYVGTKKFSDFFLLKKLQKHRKPPFFELEITARCQNNCRHCYINVPADEPTALEKELSIHEISDIAEQAVSSGTLWCLITGGEPLIRSDFPEIFLLLKKMGLLVSVFTNACLLTEEHIKLFKSYPPRAVEVTVYGVTPTIYERVTRTPGSYKGFRRGLDLLINSGVNVSLKAMALRSNISEFAAIADFCRRMSTTPFRFDPFLHLRIDRNPERNQEIKSERLPINRIVSLEKKDSERYNALKKACKELVHNRKINPHDHRIFNCGAGINIFAVGWDGSFRLCPSLSHPDCITDLRKKTLRDIQKKFIPYVRAMTASDTRFYDTCGSCPIIDLCYWCPAHAYLETGNLIEPVDYFCELAHARVGAAFPR